MFDIFNTPSQLITITKKNCCSPANKYFLLEFVKFTETFLKTILALRTIHFINYVVVFKVISRTKFCVLFCHIHLKVTCNVAPRPPNTPRLVIYLQVGQAVISVVQLGYAVMHKVLVSLQSTFSTVPADLSPTNTGFPLRQQT